MNGSSVDIAKVKKLVELMVEHDLSSVSLRSGSEEITLKRAHPNGEVTAVGAGLPGAILPAPQLPAPSQPVVPEAEPEIELTAVKSPMVGTVYSSPNPEAAAYVSVGSVVSSDTVVCIIEAMKVFNEIRAEVSGTIQKILVTNEEAVEYGQPLFLVRPD